MKADWVKQPLGECARFVDYRGKTPPKTERGIRLITAKNVKMGYIQRQPIEFIDPSAYDAWMTRGFPEFGDVLFTTEAPLGNVAQLDTTEKVIIGQRLITLKTDAHRVDPTFLKYALLSPAVQREIHSRTTGATVQGIKASLLKAVLVPLPPLEEQRRIVTVLDEAFEGLARIRAHAEANLRSAQELFAGSIASEFATISSLPKRKIGDVARHSLGKMLDKKKNKGTPRGYLRNLNVRWFHVDTSDLLEMRIDDSEIERYSVRKGDLLICEGGYPGRSAIWDRDDAMFFQKALHRVRFDKEVYGKLLMFFLFMEDQSGSLRIQFSGSGIQHFTGQALAKFEMPFPSLGVAEKIVSRIEFMRQSSAELEGRYTRKLNGIDSLRQALLQKAFAGELT
ncbi:MAG: restriction endonuclease subunit M [Mesorhizobium sp.]|nr:MAG: restriction endonuclease subunit M [Mesorhizobium sp.]